MIINAMNSGANVFMPEMEKLILLCLTVFLPFLCAGLGLSVIFSTQSDRINRLYFADLMGAALGCVVCIPLLSIVTPPGTVMLAGAFFALAGLRLALQGSRGLTFVSGPWCIDLRNAVHSCARATAWATS